MFKMAVDWGYLDQNPAAGIKQVREVIKEADYLSRKEVVALLEKCEEHMRPLLTLVVNTGMRFGELMALQWRDVDQKRSLITIRDSKNHETRHVPMNSATSVALAIHRKAQARRLGKLVRYVFINPVTGQPYIDVRKAFKKALATAEIERPITFHQLRHTAASHMVMSGIDRGDVDRILGHKDPNMTLRYTHLAHGYLKGVIDRLDFLSGEEGHQRRKEG